MPVPIGYNPLAPEGFETEIKTQAWLGDSGIVFFDTDAFGCRWSWGPNNAWGAKPAPRDEVGDRTYDHGQWDNTRFSGPRNISIPGWVIAPDHGTLHFAEQRLRDAVTVTPFKFRVAEPGFDSYAMVRQQGEIPWTEVNSRTAIWSIGLYAGDPLIYSSRDRTFALAFPSVTGGATWPRTWPATWDAVVSDGSELLLNPGNEDVGIQLRIDGPATTVQIAFPELGESLNLSDPNGNPILTSGQWIDIDTDTRQVMLNGDAGRRSWAYGDFLRLPARAETKLAIAGTGTTTESGVSGTYRAARL